MSLENDAESHPRLYFSPPPKNLPDSTDSMIPPIPIFSKVPSPRSCGLLYHSNQKHPMRRQKNTCVSRLFDRCNFVRGNTHVNPIAQIINLTKLRTKFVTKPALTGE